MKLTRKDWIRLLLLWLGGIDLRLTMLAVPPCSEIPAAPVAPAIETPFLCH